MSRSFVKLKTPEELETGDDIERAELLPAVDEKAASQPKQETSTRQAVTWMVVNTLATIGIVFTNKAIFSDPSLKLAQLTFAAFHFFVTWLTLFTISRPRFAYFVPRTVAIKEIIPLAVAMSLNVILPNLSLAFSTTTSMLGVIFAFSGIFASSLYTVWIASYHKKLQMNSMQLLFNQAPLAAFMLLYVIPFVDTFPTWTEVPVNRWVMIIFILDRDVEAQGPTNQIMIGSASYESL
ncbi:solute carrier family 35 member E3 [Diplocarpon rosae]|nr:solute carrier family 35 member E3 [Diplocarpon rosae]